MFTSGAAGAFQAGTMATGPTAEIRSGDGSIPCPSTRAALLRLGPEGNLDPSFGRGGLARVPSCGWGTTVASLAVGPEGEIVTVGGYWTKWRREAQGWLTGTVLPTVDRFSADGHFDRRFGRHVLRTAPVQGTGGTPSAEHLLLWRGRIVVALAGEARAFVVSRRGRFERRLLPAGGPDQVAGHLLGMAVQNGVPVVVSTHGDERDLTVRRLQSPGAARSRR